MGWWEWECGRPESYSFDSYSSKTFFFMAGNQTHGFLHTRRVLYQWVPPVTHSVAFCWERDLKNKGFTCMGLVMEEPMIQWRPHTHIASLQMKQWSWARLAHSLISDKASLCMQATWFRVYIHFYCTAARGKITGKWLLQRQPWPWQPSFQIKEISLGLPPFPPNRYFWKVCSHCLSLSPPKPVIKRGRRIDVCHITFLRTRS